MMYGYARVSSRDQNLDRQLIALADFGVDGERVFADKASGRDFDRPAWRALMGALRAGDVLVVKSIDRLGRSYAEIQDAWRAVTGPMGCAVVVLDMPLLDTREAGAEGLTGRFVADLALQILSYVAQLERENIRSRQAEGIAAARARGVRLGRPAKERPSDYEEVRGRLEAGTITKGRAAEGLGVCVSTLDKWLRQDAAARGDLS